MKEPFHKKHLCRYNFLKQQTVPTEADLIEGDILALDERLKPAEMTLNWHCEDVMEYLEDIQARTTNLEQRVRSAQENVKTIRKEMSRWSEDVLYVRIEPAKDEPPLLDLASREARRETRFQEVLIIPCLSSVFFSRLRQQASW